MTAAKIAVGTPEVPGLVVPGDDLVYLADVACYGCMELVREVPGGYLLCKLDRGGEDVFEPHEVSTPEAVAAHAAAALDR